MNSTRIELLSKDNYDTWRMQVKALLIKNDAWEFVSGSKVKPSIAEGAQAVRVWEIGDQKARSDLILSISPSVLKQVRNCETARETWLKLESVYASRGPAKKATLLKKLMLQRMKEGEDIHVHIVNFFDAVDKLDDMGVNINEDLLASCENFRCAIETRDVLPNAEVLKVKIMEEYDSREQSTTLDIQGAMVVSRHGKGFDKARKKSVNKHESESANNERFRYRML